MTMTTDPRTVRQGRVAVSMTSTVKRDALVGRIAQHTLRPFADSTYGTDAVLVRITDVHTDNYPRGVIVTGSYAGRTARLDSVVTLVCSACHYSSGHTSWCPERHAR